MSTSKQQQGDRVPRSQARPLRRARKAKSGGASPLVLVAGLVVVLALVGGVAFALTRPSPQSPAHVPESDFNRSQWKLRTGSQGLLVSAATHGHDPYPLVEAREWRRALPSLHL